MSKIFPHDINKKWKKSIQSVHLSKKNLGHKASSPKQDRVKWNHWRLYNFGLVCCDLFWGMIFAEVPQRIVKLKIIWMLEKILLCYRVSKIKETRLVRSFLQKPLGINLMGVSETCSVWIFKMSRILKICFI